MNYYSYIETQIGILEVVASDEFIHSVLFVDNKKQNKVNELTLLAQKQIKEYFQGERKDFNLPIDAKGTNFQKSVWQQLRKIEYGVTCTYRDVAHAIENPKAARAVGNANRNNPITIVVPCHRVIGANGSLTGYAFGLNKKEWLLNHESKYRSQDIAK